MIFVIGPLFAGKREFIRAALELSGEELERCAVWDVQELAATAPDLDALADELAQNQIVIATETGGGVVPMEAEARQAREAAGRLACLLARRADTVVRVCCGLPQILKGTLPC